MRDIGLNSPFVFTQGEARPAPGLGEHTRDILGEFLTPEEFQELTQAGIIGKKERGSS